MTTALDADDDPVPRRHRLDATASSVSHLSAPIYDTETITAATAATEAAAWEAFERATFPALNR